MPRRPSSIALLSLLAAVSLSACATARPDAGPAAPADPAAADPRRPADATDPPDAGQAPASDPAPPVSPPVDPSSEALAAAGPAPDPSAAAPAAALPSGDICEVTAPADEPRLDQLRREMFETVCESARWFDGFFGSRRYDEEARKTHGRAQLRLVYDEHDELEVDGRFRARYELPNLDRRVNAFLGREDEEEFVSGVDEGFDFLPDFFRQEGREEWILGLGYRPVSGDRRQTDFDVGVEVRTPLEPFVRGRYRQYWLIGDRNLLRFQESLYWTNVRGFGGTTNLDFERPIGDRFLIRWGNRGTLDEESEGLEWYSGVTLYHGFGPDQAVALSLGAEGETDDEVPLHEYGARLTYRRRMLREWFFGELIGGVSWPRDVPMEPRETSWHFGFGFEIQFSGEDLGVGEPEPAAPPPPPPAPPPPAP